MPVTKIHRLNPPSAEPAQSAPWRDRRVIAELLLSRYSVINLLMRSPLAGHAIGMSKGSFNLSLGEVKSSAGFAKKTGRWVQGQVGTLAYPKLGLTDNFELTRKIRYGKIAT